MEQRIKKLKNKISIVSWGSVAGKKEASGPIGTLFDYVDRSDTFGKTTWEQAESESQHLALNFALNKKNYTPEDLGVLLAGDLINQCTGSAYGLLDFDIPFLGIYGACSTCAEGLLIGSLLLESGHFLKAGTISSSHFCSAERQFRTPLEYGGQRAPTAQWTVTGAGAFILEKGSGEECSLDITEVLPGKTQNGGIDDPSNMGAAMAPAAFDTLLTYFKESNKHPCDFDLILTGDLGYEGSEILKELSKKEGVNLDSVHRDCGLMIYDRKEQDVHAGGSGCGCAATVLASKILPEMQSGRLKNILFMATGALMSADSLKQGLTIPAIAHLIHIQRKGNNQ